MWIRQGAPRCNGNTSGTDCTSCGIRLKGERHCWWNDKVGAHVCDACHEAYVALEALRA